MALPARRGVTPDRWPPYNAPKHGAGSMRLPARLLIAAFLATGIGPPAGHAQSTGDFEQTVSGHVQELLPDNNAGGVAVALRANGKTSFYNYGMADAARQRRITSDSIFNLASVGKLFATTLLAVAVKRGEMRLDDPVAKYVTELQKGGDIQEVTLGQIASHTSGLPREPGQYETWHRGKYTLPDFIRFLNEWQADPQHEPGQQDIYSNLAMILLRLALERRFNEPFATLMKERITGPLGMDSTALKLSPAQRARAVQGYGPLGRAIGQPGIGTSSNMDFAVAGQIFSSPRDMAVFLTANMGELADAAKVGIVILENRGRQKATRVGRQILRELARAMAQEPPAEGADPD